MAIVNGGFLVDNNTQNVYPKTGTFIAQSGGAVNLSSGYTNSQGFLVAVAGDDGLLKVKLMNSSGYAIMPFFFGWNPLLVTEIAVYTGNTATSIYWGT
jgi:hypothetical protein